LLVDIDAGAARSDENEIGGVTHFARRRRFQNDLRTNASHVTEGDG
jgi:hypothetical protein